jgi:hypothetical protein
MACGVSNFKCALVISSPVGCAVAVCPLLLYVSVVTDDSDFIVIYAATLVCVPDDHIVELSCLYGVICRPVRLQSVRLPHF